MQYEYPWIPDGEPIELAGNIKGAKADLVKNVLRITVDVPLTVQAFALRNRLAAMVEVPFRVAVDIQALRMQIEKLADLRSAPAAPGQDRQYALGDVLAEVAERVNAGELGPDVSATVSGPEPLPTLLEAQVAEAAEIVKKYPGSGTISLLQRKMRIGYTRAAQLIDALRDQGVLPAEDAEQAAAD